MRSSTEEAASKSEITYVDAPETTNDSFDRTCSIVVASLAVLERKHSCIRMAEVVIETSNQGHRHSASIAMSMLTFCTVAATIETS